MFDFIESYREEIRKDAGRKLLRVSILCSFEYSHGINSENSS